MARRYAVNSPRVSIRDRHRVFGAVAVPGQQARQGGEPEPWEAGDDPGVRVLVKRIGGGLLEVVCCLAGRVGLTEQGRPRRLVGVGRAEVGELGLQVVVGREAGRGDLAVA